MAFDQLAAEAADMIASRTYGKALQVHGTAMEETLKRCQVRLVHALNEQAAAAKKTAGGLIQSASADGYSESYAPAEAQEKANSAACERIIRLTLSANPNTIGMLSRGCW